MKRACRNRHAYLAEDRVENYSVVLRGLPSEWHGRSGLRQVYIAERLSSRVHWPQSTAHGFASVTNRCEW